jgi:hypothetical protein
MNDSALMIEWGMPVVGRETRALEEFASTVAWWTELQSKGKIGSFANFGTLSGNMHSRSGFALIHGSAKQIGELAESEEYRKRIARIAAICENVQVNFLETGDRMMTRMQRYGTGLKELGIKG